VLCCVVSNVGKRGAGVGVQYGAGRCHLLELTADGSCCAGAVRVLCGCCARAARVWCGCCTSALGGLLECCARAAWLLCARCARGVRSPCWVLAGAAQVLCWCCAWPAWMVCTCNAGASGRCGGAPQVLRELVHAAACVTTGVVSRQTCRQAHPPLTLVCCRGPWRRFRRGGGQCAARL
jgi:hypothetical protein